MAILVSVFEAQIARSSEPFASGDRDDFIARRGSIAGASFQ